MKQRGRLYTILAAVVVVFAAGIAQAQTLTVVYPSSTAVSPNLSDLHGNQQVKGPTEVKLHLPPAWSNAGGNGNGNGQSGGGTAPDGALQTDVGPLVNATPGVDFDGINVYQAGYIPSDNNIAVGPNYVMETVNAAYAVYSKSGTLLLGPYALRNLWSGLGGQCAANNGGDTVVQYDRVADRWIMTQLGSLSNPYAECIAVSQTNDPTGAYYLYSYSFGRNLNDYPKFGVWPTAHNSAYLATYNLFANGASFVGPEICAYDRASMLSGAASPAALCYTGLNGASFLPADLDGATPPLDGTPGYFISLYGSSLGVYKLTPNFATQTATLSSFSTIPVASYTPASSSPQPGTSRTLDALSDRLMYRLGFRMFADHEAIVVNHAVAPGSGSGVRWYELRSPVSSSGTFSLYQQGTFAPDSNYRWMGSAAMDQSGDIAIGYSLSNGTNIYPSVRYTGRTPADALGTMETEANIMTGSGSQTGYTRWGDYSSMRIDPSDDCTFWYVNEYLPVTSSYGWYTHIGAFKFNSCGSSSPDYSLSASPSSLTLTQGGSGNSTITVTALNGFNSTVNLSVSGCPANTTCTLNPTSVTPPSSTSTLSVTTTASTPTGQFTLTIQGDASHSTTVSLTVNAAPPPSVNFTMPASLSLTVSRGSNNSVAVSVGLVGSSTSVTLSISGLPNKVNASFTPNPVNSGSSSTLKVSANRTAVRGTYNATITGKNGSYTHTTPLTLKIQ